MRYPDAITSPQEAKRSTTFLHTNTLQIQYKWIGFNRVEVNEVQPCALRENATAIGLLGFDCLGEALTGRGDDSEYADTFGDCVGTSKNMAGY